MTGSKSFKWSQSGDQIESDNCVASLKTSGEVQFSSTTLGYEDWPIAQGTYCVCMVFNWNRPYETFVCADNTVAI